MGCWAECPLAGDKRTPAHDFCPRVLGPKVQGESLRIGLKMGLTQSLPGSWEGPPGRPLFQPHLISPKDRELTANMETGREEVLHHGPGSQEGSRRRKAGVWGHEPVGTGIGSTGDMGGPVSSISSGPLPPAMGVSLGCQLSATSGD